MARRVESGAACLPIITTAARCCVLTCAAATSQLRASIFVGASTAVGAALGTTSALTSGDARRRSMHSFMALCGGDDELDSGDREGGG